VEELKLYVARHGQTNYNVLGLCNDDPKKDVHLTKLGVKQSEELAEKLRNKKIDLIIVSELPRTRETAEIINKHHKAPILVDKRLNDRKTGFEGKPVSEFQKAVEPDRLRLKFGDGESFLEEKERVLSFLEDLKKVEANSVLVVTHSEPIQIINGYFKKLSDEEMLATKIKNCQLLEYNL